MILTRFILLSFTLFTGALTVGATEVSQRRIIDDFEDVGTWRQREGKGQRPDAWFAAQVFFGGSNLETRNGSRVGELRYVPDPSAAPPYRFGFERVKATLLTSTPDGIEFDANPKGRAVAFRFVLRDARRKTYATDQVKVSGDGWRSCRLELNASTVPDWRGIQFPVYLQRVTMETDDAREGAVFIDDLAFTGKFAEADQFSIRPVYAGIANEPGKPVSLVYRASNALPRSVQSVVRIRIHTADGRFLVEKSEPVSLPPSGVAEVTLSPGVLPVGAYQVDVRVEGEGLHCTYDDVFGVFEPNNRRLNTRPMWIGVQDQTIWEGEGERRLHLEWSRQLGSDADRVAGGSTRLEFRDGQWAFDGWNTVLGAYDQAGIDVLFTYFELPPWMSSDPKRNRTPVKDYDRFERHAAEFGRFIAGHPSVKYVQFWNEPDSGGPNVGHGFFHGTRDDYLKMFETFSRGFRSTNKTTKLTTGGLTLGDEIAGLSRGAIVDHSADYDIAAFHSHGSLENYESKELKIEGWLKESGLEKRILNSETGERSGYTRAGRFNQAVTLVKKVAYAKSRPSSELYLWFTLQDYWDMDPEADDSFGLVTSDNRAKPSFVACNELIRQLANTDPAGEVDLHAAVRTLRFHRDDGSLVYVCWLKQGEASAQLWLKSASGEVRVTDMFGRSWNAPVYEGVASVPLGAGPVYLSAGTGELSAVPDREMFIQAPGSIVIDGDEGGRLPITFREPQGREASGRVILANNDGTELCSAAIKLAAGAAHTAVVPVPAATAGKSERSLELKIEWSAGDDRQTLSLPIRVLSAYPIRHLPAGGPFAPAQLTAIEKLPVIVLDQVEDVVEFAFDPSISPWRGPKDLSAQVRVAHDGKGLYLRFDVTDDKQVQVSTPSRLDRGDSVQVGVAGHDGVTQFFLGLRDEGEQVIWCNRSPNLSFTGRWDTPLRIARSGNVTRYEAYVPADRLGLDLSKSGQAIRFSFNVNEDDGQRPDRWQRRVRYLRWRNGVANESDRLGYGILK